MKTNKYTTLAYVNQHDEIHCVPCASKSTEQLTSILYTYDPQTDAHDLFCLGCDMQIHETL